MSRSKTILQSVAMALLLAACAVPAWVPPADHPAAPDALDGTRTSPTALKRYRDAASGVESVDSSQTDVPSSKSESDTGGEKNSHHHHGGQDVRP